jgi:elongation factor Ts
MTAQSLLSTLRKRTGYAITNCKKALEMNNNDVEKVLE